MKLWGRIRFLMINGRGAKRPQGPEPMRLSADDMARMAYNQRYRERHGLNEKRARAVV